MIVQVVYLEIPPANRERFLEIVLANVAASRMEEGVVQFDLLEQQDAPGKFILYETYQDQAALAAHRLTLHFQEWVKRGVPLLTGERIRVLYKPVEN